MNDGEYKVGTFDRPTAKGERRAVGRPDRPILL